MRRSIITGALLALPFSALSAVSWSPPASAQNDPASRALRYLVTQESGSDGSIPSPFPSYAPTVAYVVGSAAAGYDPTAMGHGGPSAVQYLQAHAADASASAGGAAQLLQAIAAARGNPSAFGGVNVLGALAAQFHAATGAYGNGQTFTQALAVIGLRAAAQPVPPAALTWLRGLENRDGGWSYQALADATASDTNSTAMALMALNATGDRSRNPAALAYLRSLQTADAGFPYAAGSPSDSSSDGLVVQALIAAGETPTGCAWARGTATPYTALLALQGTNGGYRNYLDAEDGFTTAPLVAALALQPLPVVPRYARGSSTAAETAAGLAALRYLRGAQSASDGSLPTGFPSYTPAAEYAIGAAAAGYDPATLRHAPGSPSVMDYLRAHAADAASTAGAAGELIQAVVAARQDPTSFGGINLVSALTSTFHGTTGAFGNGQTFTQALAIEGLAAAGRAIPAAATGQLLAGQDQDGGWNYQGVRGGTASDTNSTAMALMALSAAGLHQADASALAWLHGTQNSDGGFPYQGGQPSDSGSDALVIGALVATFQNPAGPGWSSASGGTVVANLLALQLRGGGYANYLGTADAFSTAPTVVAIERIPHPVVATAAAGFTAGRGLDSAAPGPVSAWLPAPRQCAAVATPTPTPTPTPVLTPTAAGSPATGAAARRVSSLPTPAPTAAAGIGGVLGDSGTTLPAPSPTTPATNLVPGPIVGSTPTHTPDGQVPVWLLSLAAGFAVALLVVSGGMLARRLRG